MIGLNPRKGLTHTRRQIADQLGDVASGALLTATMDFDPRQALARTAGKDAVRFGIPAPLAAEFGHPNATRDVVLDTAGNPPSRCHKRRRSDPSAPAERS